MLEDIGVVVFVVAAATVALYGCYRALVAIRGGPGVEHRNTDSPTDKH